VSLREHYGRSPEQLGAQELRRYQVHLLHDRKLAPGTVEIRISALRFLYKKVLKRRDLDFDDLVFPKTPKKLPVVLSHEEVTQLIEAAPNLLYRTILMILYGTGLRRAEVVRLKVDDIDTQRMVIREREGKGSRDRADRGQVFFRSGTTIFPHIVPHWKHVTRGKSLSRIPSQPSIRHALRTNRNRFETRFWGYLHITGPAALRCRASKRRHFSMQSYLGT
jgi:integrase